MKWFTVVLADRFTYQRIRREAYVWIQLLHDNILPLEGVTVVDEFGPFLALVTPWMENGSLNDYLRREVGLSWERKLSMVCILKLRRRVQP
jgi:serine/threonine protein kinase